MPRKLKVYQTSLGFYDLAIAAPSMKAALEAWGSNMNLFHQSLARLTEDSKIVAVAMAKPGVVLRRPVGSNELFREHARLPTAESLNVPPPGGKAPPKKAAVREIQKVDESVQRRAAAAFEKEQQRREKQRQKEKDAAAKAHARRKAAMEMAELALQDAKREHEAHAAAIEKDLVAVQTRARAEEDRWEKSKERLETAVRKASR
jgi:colicin import membrane protein